MTIRQRRYPMISILLLGVFLLFLTACGSRSGKDRDDASLPAEAAAIESDAETSREKPSDSAADGPVVSGHGLNAPAPTGRSLQPQLANADINLDEVITLLPPDAIRSIAAEEVPGIMVTAAEADAAGIQHDVRVIGVSINGESQAYPIPFLSSHEIVNTELGGTLIAVTW